MRIGLLPLGRATFDVAFAEEKLAGMLAVLDGIGEGGKGRGGKGSGGHEFVGPRHLLMDAEGTDAALADLRGRIDRLLVLQVTFTDAGAVLAAADLDVPIAIWAVPEPRLGGRLRLNAFCGLNLAVHALGRRERNVGWLYADPGEAAADPGETAADVASLLGGGRDNAPLALREASSGPRGREIASAIAGRRIGRLGAHPDGFETCRYEPEALEALAGVSVEDMPLDRLFDAAAAVEDASAARAQAERDVAGLDAVDADQLERSLRLRPALERIREEGRFDAFAIRCWPETFTEYGGAVCAPVSQMVERRVPCACEADVYGALTQLILQEAADAPVFLVDVVDVDADDGTAVVWHCGQAPVSMAAPGSRTATVHTNRRQPLLYEFALKAGPVTFMRVSQAWNRPRMVLFEGTMLERDMAFTGTSGVFRPHGQRAEGDLARFLMDGAVEHHVALAYGSHADALREVAGAMDLAVVEL